MSTKHYISYKRYEESHGIGEYADPNRPKLSSDIIDRIADEKRDEGWTKQIRRRNKCSECYTYKSKNGSCLC